MSQPPNDQPPNDQPPNEPKSPFRLDLVPFERYMLADDRRDYPMTYPITFAFDGVVDSTLLERAFLEAVERHPLLNCFLCGRGKSLHWNASPEKCSQIAKSTTANLAKRYFDLRIRRPISWTWVDRPGGGELQILVHHAIVDGVGALQFIGDWLEIYDSTVSQRAPRLRKLDFKLLAERGNIGETGALKPVLPAQPKPSLSDIRREASRFFLRKIQSLRPGNVALPPSTGHLRNCFQIEFDRQQSTALRRSASGKGSTLNDLAMRDLMLGLHLWNRENVASERRADGWYRVTMPVNLRDRAELRMPATNRIGFAFVDRYVTGETNRDQLLESLAREHSAIRDQGLARMFLSTLSGAAKVPGAMQLLTLPFGTATTAVFSNIGELTRRFTTRPTFVDEHLVAGRMRMTRSVASPPTRPGTPASFLLSQYAGRIAITIGYNPNKIQPAAAEQILKHWSSALLENLTTV